MWGGGGRVYIFETNLHFIYYIPEISRSSHDVWDCALCDIIYWFSAVH